MTKKTPVAIAAVLVLIVALLLSPLAQAKSETTPREQGNRSVLSVSETPAPQVRYLAAKRAAFYKPLPRPAVVAPKKKKAPVRKSTTKLNKNVVGIQASAWTGKGYSPRWEGVRKCIVKRESNGRYGAINKSSRAAGAYQFLPAWNRGLAYMIGKPQLKSVPVYKWSRVDQDHGFWAAWRNGAGRHHWSGGNFNCF